MLMMTDSDDDMPGSGEAADVHRLTFLYMLAILLIKSAAAINRQ